MTQNIYDDPAFFSGYSGLRRSVEGLDGAPEWPTLRAMLPTLAGLAVVDLGCGFGWFCRWAAEQGASQVRGLDVSERMLEGARQRNPHPAILYERADLETLELPEAAFDLAYSSLVLHYIADPLRLLRSIRRALRPGGSLVFSTEHPIFTAPRVQRWVPDAEGRPTWPVSDYAREGARVSDWLAPGVVKQHRMLGTTLSLVLRAGFALTHVADFAPTRAQLAANPALAVEAERPMFLMVGARAA